MMPGPGSVGTGTSGAVAYGGGLEGLSFGLSPSSEARTPVAGGGMSSMGVGVGVGGGSGRLTPSGDMSVDSVPS